MTYDPWKPEHVEHWGKPISEALEHARTVLHGHGLKLLVGIEIVPLHPPEPSELPKADDGYPEAHGPEQTCQCGYTGPSIQEDNCRFRCARCQQVIQGVPCGG